MEIELTHNVLTVRGNRRDMSCDTIVSFHQMEIHYGYFEKVITLPHSLDPDAREGTYCNGFLCVIVGKATPQHKQKRRIDIES